MSSKKKDKNKQKKAAAAAAVAEAHSTIPSEEIEMFYQAPDPNTKMTRPASLAGKVDDSKFVIVWPANINSLKSEKEGRRVPKSHCCDNPIVAEMSEFLTSVSLVHVIEPYKMYPREAGQVGPMPGRVRVQLFKEDDGKTPMNPDLPNRRALMMRMGAAIPTLTIRPQRLAAHAKQAEALRNQQQLALKGTTGGNAAAVAAGGGAGALVVSGGGGKKKGKGRR